MKNTIPLSHFILGTVLILGCHGGKRSKVELKTDEQKVSYAIGQDIGSKLKGQGLEVDIDALAMALQDVKDGKPSSLNMEEMQAVSQRLGQKAMAKRQADGETHKKKGEAFLTENKAKPNIKITPTGLQYEVITEGKGKRPKAKDKVKVHYRGTLLDGTEFDSSYKRNEPAEFPLTNVIKGWTEALQLMPVGSKYKLYIPSDLAYGPMGNPGIPPNSVLTFEVELLEIVK